MARKNHLRPDGAGAIHFDTRTGTVMAETGKQENIKEKVLAVREVVPGKSNNEVVMVLQYFDYNVEKAIQAYLEDGAKAALQEWNFTGSQQSNKKRRNKKKAASEKNMDSGGDRNVNSNGPTLINHIEHDAVVLNGNGSLPNGHLHHGDAPSDDLDNSPGGSSPVEKSSSAHSEHQTSSSAQDHRSPLPQPSSTSLSSTTNSAKMNNNATASPQPQRHHQGRGKAPRESHSVHHNSVKQHHYQQQRERTISERSTASSVHGDSHHSLDKSFKDLQRQTTSLERLRLLLDSEIERSYKSVKRVFEELRKGLNERETKLIAEMDVVKSEANEMLDNRHSKAKELKRLVERAERMKESEIADVRSQIKHFVTDRRHDEELGRKTRFLYDSDQMLKEIEKFGEVIHVKTASRGPSSAVAKSNGTHNSDDHNSMSTFDQVAHIEERLKSSLGIQSSSPSSSVSHHQTATYNSQESIHGARHNNDASIRQSSGARSAQSRTSTAASISSSSSPQPPSSGNRNSVTVNVNAKNNSGAGNDAVTLIGSRTNYGGGRGQGYRGQGRGRGFGRGRGRGYGGTNSPRGGGQYSSQGPRVSSGNRS